MEENNYYTPDIEDLFVGYECQKESVDKDGNDIWVDYKISFEYGWLEIPKDYNQQLRTKYLDKEDIESLGWKCFKTENFSNSYFEDIREFYRIPTIEGHLNGFYWELLPNYKRHLIGIWLCNENNPSGNRSFAGKCLSINELKKIMKYLNIPTNGQ